MATLINCTIENFIEKQYVGEQKIEKAYIGASENVEQTFHIQKADFNNTTFGSMYDIHGNENVKAG